MKKFATKVSVIFLCLGMGLSSLAAGVKLHVKSGELISSGGSTTRVSQAERDQSTLTVSVGVRKGKLVVDRAKSSGGFIVSEGFRQSLRSRLSDAEVERKIAIFHEALLDDLDERFSRMQRIFEYALSTPEQDQQPQDPLSRRIRDFPGDGSMASWETFSLAFNTWVDDGTDRASLKEVFSDGGMLTDLNDVGKQTALIFTATVKKPPRPFNSERGTLKFRVADPISNLDDATQYEITFPNEPDPNKAASKRKIVLKLLASFQGELWRPKAIQEKIENFYAQRGLVGVVKISAAGKPRKIEIPEAARIARVLFSKDVPANALDKVAYLLLPDGAFRAFVKTRPLTPVSGINGALAYQSLDYKDVGYQVGTEPFTNAFQFQIQQLQLAQLGFVAFQAEAPNEIRDQTTGSVYVEIFVNKAEDEETGAKPENEPEPANLVPNDEGLLSARPEKPEARTAFVPKVPNLESSSGSSEEEATGGDETGDPDPSPTPTPSPTASPGSTGNDSTFRPKDKKNYVGFGVAYKPGQNIRVFGIFQRARLGLLSPQDDLSIKAGSNDNALGALNYSADFVLFNTLHRRLSLQVTGNSDYIANRLFDGVKTDERRTGGVVRAELEIFRDRGGSLLRVDGEFRQATVDLVQNDQLVLKQNLSTLDFGGLFLYESRTSYRPKQFRFEPLLRIGLGLARNEPAFVTFGASGGYHQQLPHFLEFDFSGHFKFASADTPIYELPTLGGADLLRGFREDDVLGRRMWSLQNELWMPLPGTSDDAKGLQRFLRRQVRLAWFVDVGGMYGGDNPGTRLGPGLGARIIYSPAIIKLDWAYGLGEAAANGRGHGRFYFSVGTNLPF